MAMDSAQIRHKNFQKLFNDFIDQHPSLPQRGMLKLFADRLNLSDRYLSHIKCNRKNIGNNVARTIEERLKLPHGWMDREHNALNMPIDEKEKLFVEMALTLFRTQQGDARELLIDMLRQRLQSQPPQSSVLSKTSELPTGLVQPTPAISQNEPFQELNPLSL